MPNLVGTSLNQVPTNSMLGGLAYQDPEHASIRDLDLKNFSQINSELLDTAVDIFVYDTSKDSDGGAWRKRTQNTSWYKETLNTATRGSRREFPSVAVIVVQTDTLTIYDGDDPDLPMWMVFKTTSGNLIGAGALRGVTALNGIMVTPAAGYTMETRFISDYPLDWFTNQLYLYKGNIEQRNDTNGFVLIESYGIVASSSNDVTMTVLPNAPIEPTTGLPTPTIAIATDGGVSVIRDNGTVVDYTYQVTTNRQANNVYLSETGRLQYSTRSNNTGSIYYVEYDQLSDFDVSTEPNVVLTVSQTSGSGLTRILPKGSIISNAITEDCTALGFNPGSYTDYRGGLFLHKSTGDVKESDEHPNDNFIGAHIRPDYNTGWMFGDCKVATLSDTDDTNLSGTNLVTNGTFDTNNNGWTVVQGSITNVSGKLVFTGSSGNAVTQNVTTVVGRTYMMTATVTNTANVGTNIGIEVGDDNNLVYVVSNTILLETKTFTRVFKATSTSTELRLWGGTAATGSWDNVTFKEVEPERTLHGTYGYRSTYDGGIAFEAFGTITKNPVATGADLIRYSTGGSGNYLRQPYNSDLDFGKNSFYIMCWVKIGGGGNGMLWHRAAGSGSVDLRCEFHSSNPGKPRFYMYGGNADELLNFNSTYSIADDAWHQVVWVKSGARFGKLYVDGKLDNTGTSARDVDVSSNGANFTIGARADSGTEAYPGDVSLFRIGAGEPSAEQIQKMYEDEKCMFVENAKATLYGTSDNITALGYDDKGDLLHVGTSGGRSDFRGLCRINNTTTAVTTAISASNELIAEQ